jgi:heme ABC exporter ATP-binding subunit CcmA
VDFDSLTFTDVTRNFGRRRALNRVSLTCRAGELVALIGPNGAGKSTLLAIAATLLKPSSGQVLYGTQPAAGADAAVRARIGLLAHDLFIYPELSAHENLRFFAELHGVANSRSLVEEALARANLLERRDDPVSSFSRGMRQRLAIERALLHTPRLLLLDEPFTGLDDDAVRATSERLRHVRDAGAIVLVTTHDLEAIEPLADRALIVTAGRVTALDDFGSPAQRVGPGGLRERYRRATSAS